MVSVPVIAHFAASAFFGNVAFSAMGFGMGICFLFVYQLGAIAGLTECCGLPGLKYAVFIQTIAALVAQPLVLWRVGLRKNLRLDLMLTLVPMQFIGTPLGQCLQDYTPSAILKIIVGVVTLAVAFWQIFIIWKEKRTQKPPEDYEMVAGNGGEECYDLGEDDEEKVEKISEPVFFLLCSEGDEKFREYMRESDPTIAVPPRIEFDLDSFPDFGDLTVDQNYRNLVHVTCEYVEKNPVCWMDRENNPLQFDRKQVARKGRNNRNLIGLLGAILDVYTEVHGCRTWVCTTSSLLGSGADLRDHFGDKLRYIHLHQDPRDACVSMRDTTVDTNMYVIAEKWRMVQERAIEIAERGNVLQISRVELDKEGDLVFLKDFLEGNAARKVATHDGKFATWEEKLPERELSIIESVCGNVMKELGYNLKSEDSLVEYTVDQVKEFHSENSMNAVKREDELRRQNLEIWTRRDRQREVLARFSQDTVQLPQQLLTGGEARDCHKLVVKTEKKDRTLRDALDNIKNELWPVKPALIWMCVFGFLSGFLGGLIGVRGPPLIIFFFFFEYPKVVAKANGSMVAIINTLVRIATYLAKPPTDQYTTTYGHETWFVSEDKYLYIAVAVISLLACPLGLYLTKYLNKAGYKASLTLLLIVNGVTMIATATLDLTTAGSGNATV